MGAQWPPNITSRVGRATRQDGGAETADRDDPNAGQGGVLSSDPRINPDFHTWNKLFLHYCDGASFGSGRTDPIAISSGGKPGQMWLRGRANFNAIIDYFLTNATLGMAEATEVILSGGSAGGLAVFYNLDHLASLLPSGVRLVGFPDAGFFLDHAQEQSGSLHYRALFQGSDPIWNVTGSGGTNLKCLAANKGSEWKCLMAQYIAPHVETPMFVMNSNYDEWQMMNILQAQCIPTPGHPCNAAQNQSLLAFRDHFVSTVASTVVAGKPANGVFIDNCYVHEQNINQCSGQWVPNCVGWSPLESGSIKWGYLLVQYGIARYICIHLRWCFTQAVRSRYKTAVVLADGRSMTPQEAFGAWYHGQHIVAFDKTRFFDNPSCHYLGHPVALPGVTSQASE